MGSGEWREGKILLTFSPGYPHKSQLGTEICCNFLCYIKGIKMLNLPLVKGALINSCKVP